MRYRFHWSAIPLLLFTFGIRTFRFMHLATQSDEGVHMTVASRLLAGQKVYLDLFENRTPGVEWLLAAVFRVTTPDLFVGRALAIGMGLITVAALYSAGLAVGHIVFPNRRPILGLSIAILASASFALSPLPIFWARFTMLEHFQAAAYALSISSLLWGISRQRPDWWLASGLMAGLAILAKQSGIVLSLVTATFLIGSVLCRNKNIRPKLAFYWFIGLIIPTGGLLVTLAIRGNLAQFLHFVSGADRLVLSTGQLTESVSMLAGWARRNPALPLGIVAALTIILRRHLVLLLLVVWTALELGALMLAEEFNLAWGGFSHYVIPAMVPLSLMVGAGLIQGWHMARARPERWPAAAYIAAVVGVLIMSMQGWLDDFIHSVGQMEYPQAGFAEEYAIGDALSMVTDKGQAIVVMGNAIFYERAQRPPASRFFHYPAYFPGTEIGEEAADEIDRVLRDPTVGALLISRLHLDRRLPLELSEAVWSNWSPAARFVYPYQSDMFLFLPRELGQVDRGQLLSSYEPDIDLLEVSVTNIENEVVLARLIWSASTRLREGYTVFVHLVDKEGRLVAQHDGVPQAGFRPVDSWSPEEQVVDWHWIQMPDGAEEGGLQLRVGLYRSETGERVRLRGAAGAEDVYTVVDVGKPE